MKDEIKVILDYLKDDKWDYYPSDGTPYKVLLMEERDKLLDYITNLQESDSDKQLEIMKLKDKLEQQRKEYQETYKDVRIEIKEKDETITNLQERCEYLERSNNRREDTILGLRQEISDIEDENEKLKELCNKYEEEHSTTFEYWKSEIDKILNGEK